MSEWINLPTMADVARAQAEGWEIEVQTDAGNDKYSPWKSWNCIHWHSGYLYRGRPAQPKMRKVKMLCYLVDNHRLNWLTENASTTHGMIRIPAEDIEIEVPE